MCNEQSLNAQCRLFGQPSPRAPQPFSGQFAPGKIDEERGVFTGNISSVLIYGNFKCANTNLYLRNSHSWEFTFKIRLEKLSLSCLEPRTVNHFSPRICRQRWFWISGLQVRLKPNVWSLKSQILILTLKILIYITCFVTLSKVTHEIKCSSFGSKMSNTLNC